MLKRITVASFAKRKRENEKIVMVTAYDAPTAAAAFDAGIDVLLVGDSLAPTVLGYRNTLPVTMEQMLHHAAAVRRGAPGAFVVFDLPFMSYLDSGVIALHNA
ncbi:MAG: 3-methyl-2-oxobutanoate hydroxymethyltransferase, partial [Lentisphaeria bacterium]|nr:3-methyl-2-oxobutanoate hydroxymethyltransferase [Lentisphaeria bacterium]